MKRTEQSARWPRSVAAALAMVFAAGTAHAGTALTPSLWRGAGDNFNCRVLNAGAADATATIEIRGQNGIVRASHPDAPLPIGMTSSATDLTPDIEGFCRVEVSGVIMSKVRVVLCLRDAENTPLACVTAP